MDVVGLQTAVHGVDPKHVVAARGANADIPAGGLNPAGIVQQANGKLRIAGDLLLDQVPGAVVRHTVHDQDFERPIVLLTDGVENPRNISRAVAHHHQHADQRASGAGALPMAGFVFYFYVSRWHELFIAADYRAAPTATAEGWAVWLTEFSKSAYWRAMRGGYSG